MRKWFEAVGTWMLFGVDIVLFSDLQPATNTSDALMSGGTDAIAGAIERCMRRLRLQSGREPLLIMSGGAWHSLFTTIESCINRQEFVYENRRQRDQRKLDKASDVERIATLRKSVERWSTLAARARMGTLLIGVRRLCSKTGKGRATIRRRLAHLEKHGFVSTVVPGMKSIFDQKAGRIARKASGRIPPMEITLTLVPAQMRPKRGIQPMDSLRVHQKSPVRPRHKATPLNVPKTKGPEPKKRPEPEPEHPLREKKFRRRKAETTLLRPYAGYLLR